MLEVFSCYAERFDVSDLRVMSPLANNLLHRQRKAPDVSFCKALQNSTWSFSFPLPQNSQVRFGVPFYALPVADEGSRLAAAVTQKISSSESCEEFSDVTKCKRSWFGVRASRHRYRKTGNILRVGLMFMFKQYQKNGND